MDFAQSDPGWTRKTNHCIPTKSCTLNPQKHRCVRVARSQRNFRERGEEFGSSKGLSGAARTWQRSSPPSWIAKGCSKGGENVWKTPGRCEMVAGRGRDPSKVKPTTATTRAGSRARRSKSFMQLGEKGGHWVHWVPLTPRWLFALVCCFHFYLHKKGLQWVTLGSAHIPELAQACGRKISVQSLRVIESSDSCEMHSFSLAEIAPCDAVNPAREITTAQAGSFPSRIFREGQAREMRACFLRKREV